MHETDSIIPELEEIPDYTPRNREWTDLEIAKLKRYWGRKPKPSIAAALDRTVSSLEQKVSHLKQSGRWDQI